MVDLPPQIVGPVTGAIAGGVTGHALGQAAQRRPDERGSVPQVAAVFTGAGLTLAQRPDAALLNPALAAAAVGWLLHGGWRAAALGALTPYAIRYVPPLLGRLERRMPPLLAGTAATGGGAPDGASRPRGTTQPGAPARGVAPSVGTPAGIGY